MQFDLLNSFEQMQSGSNPTNSTAESNDEENMSQTMMYFNSMFPIMMSMGYGGTVIAFGY